MTCRLCQQEVPNGAFCGNCGATVVRHRSDGPDWLRAAAHAAAPTERLWRPSLTSTLFPSLPRRARSPFRTALIAVIALLEVAAAARLQAPLIGLVGFGLLLVFAAYLRETNAVEDLSLGALAITAVLGTAFGVVWALGTDSRLGYTGNDALGLPPSTIRILIVDFAIPASFVILMLAPMVVIRLLPRARSRRRESLDGFIFGSFGALCFASAGSLTRLVPVFAEGVVDDGQGGIHLMIAGTIQGVAIPLTAAAVGGAVGATLWFIRRDDSVHRPRRYAFIATPVVFGAVLYLLLGLLDILTPPHNLVMSIYALVAVLALYAGRVVVHLTLLHEVPEPASSDQPVLCPQCEHVVPDLPFCPSCGVAAHAASRTSRAARRSIRPVPTTVAEGR